MLERLPEFGFMLGQYLAVLLTIQFLGMFIGYVFRALLGEVLSWTRAEPSEDGFMTRMWVTHTLAWFILANGGAWVPAFFAAGSLLVFKSDLSRWEVVTSALNSSQREEVLKRIRDAGPDGLNVHPSSKDMKSLVEALGVSSRVIRDLVGSYDAVAVIERVGDSNKYRLSPTVDAAKELEAKKELDVFKDDFDEILAIAGSGFILMMLVARGIEILLN